MFPTNKVNQKQLLQVGLQIYIANLFFPIIFQVFFSSKSNLSG